MLRTVLLPTDLSQDCPLMVRFTAGLKELGVRRVVLAHVLDGSGMEAPVIAKRVDALRPQLRELGRPLEEAGLKLEIRITAGDPFEQLLALSSELHADAIVCGSHGKGVLDELLFGSISERFVQQAPIPILLARYDLLQKAADPALLASGFARNMVVATDFSASATRALQAAIDLPSSAYGTVRLLHVVDAKEGDERTDEMLAGASYNIDTLVGMASEKGVDALPQVMVGDPRVLVCDQLCSGGTTGVIAGTRGRGPITGALLGSVSMCLLRQACCPVMIVP